ncbi:MAG: DUF4249 domain-containing protein [Bacteroidota bacterium]
MIGKRFIFIILSLSPLFGCLEEFTSPEIIDNSNILVVEGNIGDKETSIRLTRTSDLTADNGIIETNARVILEDENGTFNVDLIENENGVYSQTVSLDLSNRYKIRILTTGEQEYVSEALTILPTPTIDSVGWDATNGGVQIHVSTHDDINNTQYYRWTYEETWLYRSRRSSDFIYQDGQMRPRKRDEQIYTCWRTLSSNLINVGSSIGLTENVIFKQPVHFIEPTENVRLGRRYSINVSQYAISQEAFEFWELLKKNSESVGTFFDPQPSQLPTNLTCISDPETPVVGFLSASAVKEERIFISRADLPFRNIPLYNTPICQIDTIPNDPEELEIAFNGGFNLPLVALLSLGSGQIFAYESSQRFCVDCRLQGGTTTKPDFWEN